MGFLVVALAAGFFGGVFLATGFAVVLATGLAAVLAVVDVTVFLTVTILTPACLAIADKCDIRRAAAA